MRQPRLLASRKTFHLILEFRGQGASLRNKVPLFAILSSNTSNTSSGVSMYSGAPIDSPCSQISSKTQSATLLYPRAFLSQVLNHNLHHNISPSYIATLIQSLPQVLQDSRRSQSRRRRWRGCFDLVPYSVNSKHIEKHFPALELSTEHTRSSEISSRTSITSRAARRFSSMSVLGIALVFVEDADNLIVMRGRVERETGLTPRR